MTVSFLNIILFVAAFKCKNVPVEISHWICHKADNGSQVHQVSFVILYALQRKENHFV